MTLIQKGTRAATAAATGEEFLQSDHKSVANGKEVKENEETSDIEKRKRYIAEWIGRPHKPPPSNEDKKTEGKEEDVGATQVSKEGKSPIDKDDEGREDDQEDDHEDTVLSDAENTKEEASLGHEGKSSLSDLSERSDDNDEDDDRTGAEDNNCNVDGDGSGDGDGDGGSDRNSGSRGGSAECLRFLSLIAITEVLGAMAKAKSSLSKKSKKNRIWEKERIK